MPMPHAGSLTRHFSRKHHRQPPVCQHQQHGVALLTILVMVVIATILAASMLLKQQRSLRETGLLIRQDQALQYALAGETFAMALLSADSKTNKADSMQDLWAKPTPPYPVDGGFVQTTIIDRSGKYNINNLYHSGKVDEVQLAYFKRLLNQLGLSAEIAEAVLDWQDPDDEATGNGGAEAEFYVSKNITPANQAFTDIIELQQVRGIDTNAFRAIAPHVIAVPNYSHINVNTATLPVLTALDGALEPQSVANWIKSRQTARAIENVSDFFAVVPFSNIAAKKRDAITPLLSTQSDYFQVRVQVVLSERKRFLTSDIMRQDDTSVAYKRSLSPFSISVTPPKSK